MLDDLHYVGGDDGDGMLEPGEIWEYRGTYTTDDTGRLENTASTFGFDRKGTRADASDDYGVCGIEPPQIFIEKTALLEGCVFVGNTVFYEILVWSNVPLYSVEVSDPLLSELVYISGDDNENDILDPDEVWVYRGKMVVSKTGLIENTADAHGFDRQGTRTEAEASATIQVKTPLAITGFAFLDVDKDGIFDPTEAGVGGIKVKLLVDGKVIAETITAANGFYKFDGLYPGMYTVMIELPLEYDATTKTSVAIQLVCKDGRVDFGLVPAPVLPFTPPVPVLPFTGGGASGLIILALSLLAIGAGGFLLRSREET